LFTDIVCKHGRPQKFFQGVGQRRHFSYPFQVAEDAMRIYFHKRFTLSTSERMCPMLR